MEVKEETAEVASHSNGADQAPHTAERQPTYKMKLHSTKVDRAGSQYACEICGKRYISLPGLKIHYRRHLGELPFKCSFCGKAFPVVGSLRVHERIHTGERPFSCSICGRSFVQNGSLQSHMRTHTGDRPYVCELCGKAYTVSSSLRLHMKQHAEVQQMTAEADSAAAFTCTATTGEQTLPCYPVAVGEVPFACGAAMTEERLFACGDVKDERPFACGAAFERLDSDETSSEALVCRLCGQLLPSAAALDAHLRLHMNDAHACGLCAKRFLSFARLQRHVAKKHRRRRRRHVCVTCGRAFSKRGKLSRHQATHCEEVEDRIYLPVVEGTTDHL